MRHSFIDKYSDLNSLIHRLDPRTKAVCLIIFVLAVVTTPPERFKLFGIYSFLIVAVIILSKIPFWYITKRASLVLPFVLMTAMFLPFWENKSGNQAIVYIFNFRIGYHGLLLIWNVTIKAYLASMAMIVLSSTTKFPDLLKGLSLLKFPQVMILILSFMYRYIFVIVNEAMRMNQARKARFCGHDNIGQIRVFGNMIGMLFVRSYERAERVYQGMVSRGYDGEIRTINVLQFSMIDFLFAITFLSSLLTIWILGLQ